MSVKIDGLSELSEMLTQESVRTAKRYLVNCANCHRIRHEKENLVCQV